MARGVRILINVAEIQRETEKAFLVVLEEGDEGIWLPKNQITDPDQFSEGECEVEMSITEWIAEQKGIA